MGLATLLGRPSGFFIPYRYAASLPPAGARSPYGAIESLFQAAEGDFRALQAAIERYASDLRAIGGDPPPAPRWNQDWFPRLDAAAAYALVRERRPKRIVEVGSGHSTRFLARAVADGRFDCVLTAIDPAPRASLDGLAIRRIRTTLQDAGPAPFAGLEPGDVLFVDSSHILMPGSDVDDLLNRVLPSLPAGALVHIHDVFLPDDYPPAWAWRSYNEQQGVAPLLTGGGFRPLFASHYVATRMTHDRTGVLAGLPLVAGAFESSLWLLKQA